MLKPGLPTGARQMMSSRMGTQVELESRQTAQACVMSGAGDGGCRGPQAPIWPPLPAGAFMMHFPEKRAQCPREAASPRRRTLCVKVHYGAVSWTRAPSPHGQGQNTQPRVFSALWAGVNRLLPGRASPARLTPPLPTMCLPVFAQPGMSSLVLLSPLSSGLWVQAVLVLQ